MRGFEDKIIVITGSARGIGYAIAEEFCQYGAIPVIIDLGEELVENAVRQLEAKGYRATGYSADVTNPERIETVFKEIHKKFGKIDVLINNAGITKDGLILKMKESDWDAVINVNLKGSFICTQKVSRYMLKQRKGVILNIASVIGIMGNVGQANYAASKGGIIALTKSTAKEFSSRNIRVNAIAPGFIETEMTKQLSEKVIEEYAKAIPLGRMGTPKNVADLCIFLASNEANYITGQTIQVDGGLIM